MRTPGADGIDAEQRRIVEEFASLGDWFDRYEHLIALGKAHPPMSAEDRTQERALPGCQSQVWVRAELDDGRMRFAADSDSQIIRGVLALLVRVLDSRRPAEIASAELFFLERAGLTSRLSPTRANGVATIVRHLRQRAAESV